MKNFKLFSWDCLHVPVKVLYLRYFVPIRCIRVERRDELLKLKNAEVANWAIEKYEFWHIFFLLSFANYVYKVLK